MHSPYVQGAATAFAKFALDADMAKHVAELGGLGLLTVPALHHLLGNPETDSPGMRRGMAGTELAGLGLLAAPTIHHLMQPRPTTGLVRMPQL
jgi:hypothetical protein